MNKARKNIDLVEKNNLLYEVFFCVKTLKIEGLRENQEKPKEKKKDELGLEIHDGVRIKKVAPGG